jgi:hypothetical protein
MHNPFWDALTVKVSELFKQVNILHQHGTGSPGCH